MMGDATAVFILTVSQPLTVRGNEALAQGLT